jgi:3-phenylpropionate/trans-cinnamate dioxygenase ferredoxin reductase component
VEPAVAVGAKGTKEVEVDGQCRTTLPDVFAVGDCALHRNRYADNALVRLESVQNANDQATVVAKVLTGAVAAYDTVPWFWSNQYDLRLQPVGLSRGFDALAVRGDPATRRFSVIYLKDGAVIALDRVNSTRDFVQGKRLVADARRVDPAALGDVHRALKDL